MTKVLKNLETLHHPLLFKGRNNLKRYRAIDQYLVKDDISVLDYGCGLGYLLEYLTSLNLNHNFSYTGYDILQVY